MNNESLLSLLISSLGWILLVVASALFFAVGQPYYLKQGYAQGLKDQLATDSAKVVSRLNLPNDQQLSMLTGSIKDLSSDSFTMQSNEQPVNPLTDPYPSSRQVTFDAATVVKDRRVKTQAEINQDLANHVPNPLPFVETDASLTDLKAGEQVLITADSANIGYMTTIHAKEIYINVTPAPAGATK